MRYTREAKPKMKRQQKISYLKYFKLKEQPFATTPDPKYLYLSEIHEEALDRLVTAISMRNGVNAIIGEPGLGKSLLVRTMLSGFRDTVRFAWVFNTTLNSRELVKYVCRDFGFTPGSDDMSDILIELYTFLIRQHEQGQIAILIIDEAQNLKPDVLEEIRQMSNLETVNKKLLQIILSGQPQLDVHLEHPSLHQLKQRISLKAVLERFDLEDTRKYILHRLWIAGGKRRDLFTEASFAAVHEISKGIPRLINQVCDNALLAAYQQKLDQVNSTLVTELLEKGIVTPAGPPPRLTRPRQEAYSRFESELRIDKATSPFTGRNGSRNGKSLAGVETFDGLDFGRLTIY